jgi:hypothetical protein
MIAEFAEKEGYMDVAYNGFKKAIEFSPTNYDLNARLATFLKDQYDSTGDWTMRDESIQYFVEALKLAPTSTKIRQALAELKDRSSWESPDSTRHDTIPDSVSPPSSRP